VAGIGIVRACQKNGNGTSNLLLQGLCRIAITGIVEDEPYRRIRMRALLSEPGAAATENQRQRSELARLLRIKFKLEATAAEMTGFLKAIEDPETFVDVAAFNLCESPALKQKLLETLDVHDRFELFIRRIRREIDALRLRRKLQGGIPDERIGEN
jgi:ATP-dependent Lon protease